MSRLRLATVLSLAFVQLGCGSDVTVPHAATSAAAPAAVQTSGTNGGAAPAVLPARQIIRSAELYIEVRDVRAAAQRADSAVQRTGGIIAQSNISGSDGGRRTASLVVRVPSDSLATTLMLLRTLGDVTTDRIESQDVTKEYTDLATRLAVKEQTVARLRSLIENRTAKLADILEVERELARAVTELEEMKGGQRYYDQQIALSTIRLNLIDIEAAESTQLTGPVRTALRHSLEGMGRSFSAVIYLVTFLLPWALVIVPAWWLVNRVRAGRKATDGPAGKS